MKRTVFLLIFIFLIPAVTFGQENRKTTLISQIFEKTKTAVKQNNSIEMFGISLFPQGHNPDNIFRTKEIEFTFNRGGFLKFNDPVQRPLGIKTLAASVSSGIGIRLAAERIADKYPKHKKLIQKIGLGAEFFTKGILIYLASREPAKPQLNFRSQNFSIAP